MKIIIQIPGSQDDALKFGDKLYGAREVEVCQE